MLEELGGNDKALDDASLEKLKLGEKATLVAGGVLGESLGKNGFMRTGESSIEQQTNKSIA